MLTLRPERLHTWIEVDLQAIERNVRTIRDRVPDGCRFMAVVKADGYGHGAVQTALAALRAGADGLAVTNLEEAVRLRKHGIAAPVLALTPPLPELVDVAVRYDIAVPVFQKSWLELMRPYKTLREPLRVHVKMDTGMGRLGIRDKREYEEMVPLLWADDILVEGIYTHYASANRTDPTPHLMQWDRFGEMRQWVRESGFHGVLEHGSNSAAALHYPEHSLDMVRVGAALYGIDTRDPEVRDRDPVDLQPALAFHTSILHVKRLERGQTLGYDQSYTAPRDEWIATIPLGYADGVSRDFRGFCLAVDGERVPIVGNVCMDQLMLRLPRYFPPGTPVTFIGGPPKERITLDEASAYIGTIPQHVLTMLASRTKRVYRRGK
ncbi:alanine racemase [Paenibacillus sp. HJGM_3]|uniref:alanine racemase n=1 Tax=Paenibacillus sp. HJGM_3 TaxID=3379816 RepID=UPI00385E1277